MLSIVRPFRLLALLAVSGPLPALPSLSGQTTVDTVALRAAATARIMEDIRYLADDRLAGRGIGSRGADSAAEYLARRFAEVGLQASPRGWFQPFTVARDAPAAVHARVGELAGRNVVGVLPGRDPELRNELIIVGAHYDHLGLGGFGSLDPHARGTVHNGADDNASGTAALIHIAKRLQEYPLARTVVFIAFSGEELGLLGSSHYVKNPLYPLNRTLAMINLDMVGRLRDRRLIVYGTATAREFPALLDSLNWYATAGFDLRKQGDGYGPSDQSSFYAAKIPVLHLFTDLHGDYHRPTDDWQRVNADGVYRVAEFTVGLVRALANRAGPLTFVETAPAASSPPAVTPGYGAYLGTIPDMTESPGGVRISGVRAGSPADKAGLRGNDIIVRIGGMETPNLQAMTEALRSHKPGDEVEIRYIRDGATRVTRAVLGSRGG